MKTIHFFLRGALALAVSASPLLRAAPPATPAPRSEMEQWFAQVDAPQQESYRREVQQPRDAGLEDLRKAYLAALDRGLATASTAARLDEALGWRTERQRFIDAARTLPPDDADLAAPAAGPKAIAAALTPLRQQYRTRVAQLEAERLTRARAALARYEARVTPGIAQLTKQGRLDDAVLLTNKLEEVRTAWLAPAGSGPAVAIASAAATAPTTAPSAPAGTPTGGTPTLQATKDRPFINSLGMKFVPVPGTGVLFCIHETRYKDYAAYAAEASGVDGSWKDQTNDGVAITARAEDHPVMKVSWEDAQAFCQWLSKKEGKTYRLPTDEEWSYAVGIGREERRTKDSMPANLAGKVAGEFPWGDKWPPSKKSGNYRDQSRKAKLPRNDTPYLDHDDGYPTTAPVMSFEANKLGIYDLGGNVWEWCEDWYDSKKESRVLRGACYADIRGYLQSSDRTRWAPGKFRQGAYGFRVVVVNSER